MSQGVIVGLSDLHYALLVDDPTSGSATYQAPVTMPGAISAKINPNSSVDTLFADDGPYETATTLGKVQLDLNLADLPIEMQAVLFGHTLAGGVLVRKSSDVPPWVAIGFKSIKSNGSYRYTWLAKGKFSLPQEDNQTKADKISFQTPTIQGNFVKRDCDDEWERHIDEDNINYVSSMGTNWFNTPYGGSADTTPPTVTSVTPTNAATGVADNTTVVWVFSEALALTTVTTGTFLIVNDSTGAGVTGTLSISTDRTTVTFTPSANFDAATAYRAIVTTGVTDLAGNALVAPDVTKFTTV